MNENEASPVVESATSAHVLSIRVVKPGHSVVGTFAYDPDGQSIPWNDAWMETPFVAVKEQPSEIQEQVEGHIETQIETDAEVKRYMDQYKSHFGVEQPAYDSVMDETREEETPERLYAVESEEMAEDDGTVTQTSVVELAEGMTVFKGQVIRVPRMVLEAVMLVQKERAEEYGAPEKSFEKSSMIWDAIDANTSRDTRVVAGPVQPSEVILKLIGLKIARESHRHGYDTVRDIIGYGLLLAKHYSEENGPVGK